MKLEASQTSASTGLAASGPFIHSETSGYLAGFLRCERAAGAIIAGLAFPVLAGSTGLAFKYSQILNRRTEAQRTVDLASHAGAAANTQTSDTRAMTNAAKSVAELNDFHDTESVLVWDTSVPMGDDIAVRATIRTLKPFDLPQLVGGDTAVDSARTPVSGATGGGSAYVKALDPNRVRIKLSGEASMRADECSVASNIDVTSCDASFIKDLTHASGYAPKSGHYQIVVGLDGTEVQSTHTPQTNLLRRLLPDLEQSICLIINSTLDPKKNEQSSQAASRFI